MLTGQQPWKLVKNSDGIRVYSKMDNNSSIKIVKAETEIKTTLSALFYLLTDVDNQPNWVFNCKNPEILKKIDNFHWYYYTQIDVPWPITDRDVVTFVETKQDSITKTLIMKSVAKPDYIPENPECVRVPQLTSLWILEPLYNGNIHVTLELKIDIGGAIPQWVTNLFVSKGPYYSLKNIMFEIEKPKYKEIKLDFIQEPFY
jgi:hypothetical protein